jgi:hypothetical protein
MMLPVPIIPRALVSTCPLYDASSNSFAHPFNGMLIDFVSTVFHDAFLLKALIVALKLQICWNVEREGFGLTVVMTVMKKGFLERRASRSGNSVLALKKWGHLVCFAFLCFFANGIGCPHWGSCTRLAGCRLYCLVPGCCLRGPGFDSRATRFCFHEIEILKVIEFGIIVHCIVCRCGSSERLVL